MGLFSMLKRNSKLALKGNWGSAILLMLIVGGVSILISGLRQAAYTMFVPESGLEELSRPYAVLETEIFAEFINVPVVEWVIMLAFFAAAVLLLAPLELGIMRWYFRVVHGEKNGIGEAFSYFETGKSLGRAIWYDINMYVRFFVFAVLFYIIPGGIFGVSIYFLRDTKEISRALSSIAGTGLMLSGILFILATIFYAAWMNRYFLVPYLLAEGGDITVRKAIKRSVAYTKGFRFSILWFMLSFFGWALLSIVVFPVFFYTVPYCSTAMAMYARYIIEKNRFEQPDFTQEFKSGGDTQAPDEPVTEADGDVPLYE